MDGGGVEEIGKQIEEGMDGWWDEGRDEWGVGWMKE